MHLNINNCILVADLISFWLHVKNVRSIFNQKGTKVSAR